MAVGGQVCSPHTLIVDMVREKNAIKLSEIQQKIIEDHVNFEGINSVSLSTVDRVLKRNRLRMKPLYNTHQLLIFLNHMQDALLGQQD